MNISELTDKRICVLLSGGVDSSVAVFELARLGLHPDCFYIKIGDDETADDWDCSMEEDLEMATAVARKYGCRLEVVDCHREYWEQVTAYTMNKVRAGLTPNPDVMCNRLIKFGAFHEKCGHQYDLIATGHYAQTEMAPFILPPKGEANPADKPTLKASPFGGEVGRGPASPFGGGTGGAKWLCTAPDPVKDQTDFLAQIAPWQLEKAIFPIGHYVKDEVRRIAEREHLASARRRDSQGICFLGKIDYNEYLRRYLGEQQGDVVELETGRRIGRHQGHWFHTIGQRKGLGLGGGPWFVVRKDVEQNILYVSHGYDPATAYRQHFLIRDFHSLNDVLPPALEGQGARGKGQENTQSTNYPLAPCSLPLAPEYGVTIKIRHTPEWHRATLESVDGEEGSYIVHCEHALHGVAPGQFCVVYDADAHRCYGSAEISL